MLEDEGKFLMSPVREHGAWAKQDRGKTKKKKTRSAKNDAPVS